MADEDDRVERAIAAARAVGERFQAERDAKEQAFSAREAAREGAARAMAPERGLSFARVVEGAVAPEIEAEELRGEAAQVGAARAMAPERGLGFTRVVEAAPSPEIDEALDGLADSASPQGRAAAFRSAMAAEAPIRGAAEPTLPRVFDDPRQMQLPTALAALESHCTADERHAAQAQGCNTVDHHPERDGGHHHGR
jgi:hypothetical protein